MMNETTPVKIILLTTQILMEEDVDIDALFAHANVSMQQLLDDDGVMTVQDVVALTQSARIMSGDPALGLRLGQELGIEALDIVGMLSSTAPSLREALKMGLHHTQLLITGLGRGELVEEGETARIIIYLADALDPISVHSMEFVSSTIWNIGRRLVKGDLVFQCITFRGPEPAWLDEYSNVFGSNVEFVFNAFENSIVMDRRLLDLPMARHSPGLYQHLLKQAAQRLANRPRMESVSATVKGLVDEHISEHHMDLTVVAGFMGLTPRTLQRRLKEENTNFQTILDARRRQFAEEWLLSENIDISTIALMLGYSEPATFLRAFKGWAGVSPGEFRRRNGFR
jgi:AraC-like DNA-binding protein